MCCFNCEAEGNRQGNCMSLRLSSEITAFYARAEKHRDVASLDVCGRSYIMNVAAN
jgi:hypothetical protein